MKHEFISKMGSNSRHCFTAYLLQMQYETIICDLVANVFVTCCCDSWAVQVMLVCLSHVSVAVNISIGLLVHTTIYNLCVISVWIWDVYEVNTQTSPIWQYYFHNFDTCVRDTIKALFISVKLRV